MSELTVNQYERQGDKENSPFFEEFLPKIYERREKSGLSKLLKNMRAVLVQVQHKEAISYLQELYLMSPYRFKSAYENASHKIYILSIKPNYPDYIVLEPKDPSYSDQFTALNLLYQRALEKPQVRYIGEIYQTENLSETVKILEEQHIRFLKPEQLKNEFMKNVNFRLTEPSYFTNNSVCYTESDLSNYENLEIGSPFDLTEEQKQTLQKSHEIQVKYGMTDILYGIDHIATRVLCHSREDALLEFITMTNYYFWGAYNIDDQNSSTNICRNPGIDNELLSPAKVFTANNTPFYTNSIVNLPSPTEDFVRNFGRRMHHIAYEVEDGEQPDGTKNIDYVVGKLIENEIDFLAHIIGECKDIPDLKQIFSKTSNYSFLITEYVQRCKNFAGFFTKTNVGYLTQAAGLDAALKN